MKSNCAKNEVAASQKKGIYSSRAILFTKLMLMMLLLLCLASADELPALAEHGIQVVNDSDFEGKTYNCTQDVDLSCDILKELQSENASALIDNYNGAFYELAEVDQNTLMQSFGNGSSVNKRCNPTGNIVTYKEWQTAQSGTWWSPWYPRSCCFHCDKGPLSCSAGLKFGFTYSWSASAGLKYGKVKASTSLEILHQGDIVRMYMEWRLRPCSNILSTTSLLGGQAV